MEDDLISKKDLLELTDISYGQLYRWKRKGLVPEDWFIRKSTYTGQETFFPRNKILPRIERIKNMKDDISLDDLADVFSPNVAGVVLKADDLIERNIVTRQVLEIYLALKGDCTDFYFNDILEIYILGKFISSGDIGMDEGRLLIEVVNKGLVQFKDETCEVILMRKLGVFTCFVLCPPSRLTLDSTAKLVGRANIRTAIEELKLKLI